MLLYNGSGLGVVCVGYGYVIVQWVWSRCGVCRLWLCYCRPDPLYNNITITYTHHTYNGSGLGVVCVGYGYVIVQWVWSRCGVCRLWLCYCTMGLV